MGFDAARTLSDVRSPEHFFTEGRRLQGASLSLAVTAADMVLLHS